MLIDYELFYDEPEMNKFTNVCNEIIGTLNSYQGLVLQNTTLAKFREQMKQEQGDIGRNKNALTKIGIDVPPRDKKWQKADRI